MAPKTAKNPKKTARFYRDNPKSRAKKNAAQRKLNKSPGNKQYRAELNKARRKAGEYGKGGKDFSHTKSGRIVRENSTTNRARNRGKK